MTHFYKTFGRFVCELGPEKCGSCRVNEHSLHDCLPGDTLDYDGLLCCIGCGHPTDHSHDACGKIVASRIATRFGGIGGDHHKQWVIDQMLRAILGDKGYQEWVTEMNSEPGYEDDPWDEGIPP